jgi:hypothetical protein
MVLVVVSGHEASASLIANYFYSSFKSKAERSSLIGADWHLKWRSNGGRSPPTTSVNSKKPENRWKCQWELVVKCCAVDRPISTAQIVWEHKRLQRDSCKRHSHLSFKPATFALSTAFISFLRHFPCTNHRVLFLSSLLDQRE